MRASLVYVVVGLLVMSIMLVLVDPVLARVLMVMHRGVRAVLMGMRVLMSVLVLMLVDVLVFVHLAVVGVFMAVSVFVSMAMAVGVLVIAFHGFLLNSKGIYQRANKPLRTARPNLLGQPYQIGYHVSAKP